jgi:hypothetical protein
MAFMDYDSLPAHLREGLRRYFEQGIETGSFLRSVLEGDRQAAFQRADIESLRALPRIFNVLKNAPEEAWGSHAKVQAWINDALDEGIDPL